jgi:hypothetical protein
VSKLSTLINENRLYCLELNDNIIETVGTGKNFHFDHLENAYQLLIDEVQSLTSIFQDKADWVDTP